MLTRAQANTERIQREYVKKIEKYILKSILESSDQKLSDDNETDIKRDLLVLELVCCEAMGHVHHCLLRH